MNWPNEPATESQLSRLRELGYSADCPLTKGEAASLIRVLEPVPATEAEVGGTGGQEVVTHTPYALRLCIEHTRRAVAEAEADQIVRLQCSFASVIAKRREFWADTCRDPGQMKARSSSTLELYMKQGCRFVTPTHEQVQEILDALDTASPFWDRDNAEIFYQTLELNFPELVRHTLV